MKLNCVNIPTVRVDEMRDFYSFVLRAPYDGSHGGPDRYEIPVGEAWIVICRVSAMPKAIPENCGLEFVVEDVDAEYSRLLAAGVKIENPPVTYPWGWRAIGFKDPDGNNIDFVQNINSSL